MPYNSNHGLYYNILFNGVDYDINSNILGRIEVKSSIFQLFPHINLALNNYKNQLILENLVAVGTPINIEIGGSEEESEIYKNFIIEMQYSIESRTDLGGLLSFPLINKNAQKLLTSSPARGFKNKLSSKVIDTVAKEYEFSSRKIDKTTNKGNWISPNIESDYNFLKILKNRSITRDNSKMFMWIGLDGSFNFKSFNEMLSQNSVKTFDFTDDTSEFYAPTNFKVMNTGIRYRDYEINQKFKEYIFNKDEKLEELESREYKTSGFKHTNIHDIMPFNRDQDILYNYSHSKLPTYFNRAKYINSYLDSPILLSFRIKNIEKDFYMPGNTIEVLFPYGDSKNEYDPIYSGKYLIASVHKEERNGTYAVDLDCITDSIRTEGKDLLYFKENT